MAILGTFIKQPADVVDYDVDFGTEWLPTGDKLASASASVTPSGLTLGSTIIDVTETVVKQWVSGGTAGTTYKVEITATTDAGRVKQVEFKVKLKEY